MLQEFVLLLFPLIKSCVESPAEPESPRVLRPESTVAERRRSEETSLLRRFVSVFRSSQEDHAWFPGVLATRQTYVVVISFLFFSFRIGWIRGSCGNTFTLKKSLSERKKIVSSL
jgi:hypothetical protein